MRHRTLIGAIAALALSPALAPADVSTETIRDISLERASVTLTEGGDARVQFVVSNDSPEPITIVGISSDQAETGEVIALSHHGAPVEPTILVLMPDEEMDFSTSHIQAKLSGVEVEFGILEFRLLLSDGFIEGEAHVH